MAVFRRTPWTALPNSRDWSEPKRPKGSCLPVIAIHGADVAFERTWKDIRRIVHDRINLWLTTSELKQAYTRFENLNRKELSDYKNEHLTGDEE